MQYFAKKKPKKTWQGFRFLRNRRPCFFSWIQFFLGKNQSRRRYSKRACLTSSREKRTPPMGAPKATDTPAAAAAESISRIFASLWRYFGNSFAIKRPQQHATWTSGPSLPVHSLKLCSFIKKNYSDYKCVGARFEII